MLGSYSAFCGIRTLTDDELDFPLFDLAKIFRDEERGFPRFQLPFYVMLQPIAYSLLCGRYPQSRSKSKLKLFNAKELALVENESLCMWNCLKKE